MKRIYHQLTLTVLGAIVLGQVSNIMFSNIAHGTTIASPAAHGNNVTQTEREAREAVTTFFDAQRSGDVSKMLQFSVDINSDDPSQLKTMYTMWCKQRSQVSNKVTDLRVIDGSLVLASVEVTYKDLISISCIPVYKIGSQWKVINGIPVAGYASVSDQNSSSANVSDIKQTFQKILNAEKSGNADEALNYILWDKRTYSREQMKSMLAQTYQHVKVVDENVTDVRTVGSKLAIASVETRTSNSITVANVPVYEVDGQWKAIFGVSGGAAISVSGS